MTYIEVMNGDITRDKVGTVGTLSMTYSVYAAFDSQKHAESRSNNMLAFRDLANGHQRPTLRDFD